jgi:LEA14-like dessication related protein
MVFVKGAVTGGFRAAAKKTTVAAVCLLFVSCASLTGLIEEKPEVTLKRFDIEAISLKDVTFLFEIALHNPYPVGFTLQDVGFTVAVEGNLLFKTRTPRGVTVRPRRSEITAVTVTLAYDDIMGIVRNYTRKESLDCVIDIDVTIPLPQAVHAIKKQITFSQSVRQKVPALKPSFAILNVAVQAPTLDEIKRSLAKRAGSALDANRILGVFEELVRGSKTAGNVLDLAALDVPVGVSFDVEVKNNTSARLNFRELTYDLYLSDVRLISGTTDSITNEGSRSVLRISNTFSSKALGSSVVNMLTSRTGTYQLKGHSSVKFPDEIKTSPLRLDFDEKGRFRMK